MLVNFQLHGIETFDKIEIAEEIWAAGIWCSIVL